MLKIVISLVLLAHGIGNSMGILQVLKVATVNPQWQGDSWILRGFAGTAAAQAIGVAVWTLAIVGFVLLAGVVVGWLPQAWWQPLAIASAGVSLVGLCLFPIAFPLFSTVGAAVIDVALLAAVLWYHWTPTDLTA